MLEKVEELSSLASPQIAGSLIKKTPIKTQKFLYFLMKLGGGGSSCDDVIMEIHL